MNKFATFSAVGLFLGGFVISSNFAAAQDDSSEKVTVIAPYITNENQKVTGVGKNRGSYQVHEVSTSVSYADLDLAKPADAKQFLQRIKDEAKSDCAKIKAQFPEPPHVAITTDEECAREAAEEPLEVANAIIKTAQSSARTASQ